MIDVGRNMLPVIKTNKECSYLVVSTVLSLPTYINTRIFIAVNTYFRVKAKFVFTMAGVQIFPFDKISGRTEEANRTINTVVTKVQEY